MPLERANVPAWGLGVARFAAGAGERPGQLGRRALSRAIIGACRRCPRSSRGPFLREKCVGSVIARVDLAAFSALKTYDPPLSALSGLEIDGVSRHGKSSTSPRRDCTWCSTWPGPAGCAGATS